MEFEKESHQPIETGLLTAPDSPDECVRIRVAFHLKLRRHLTQGGEPQLNCLLYLLVSSLYCSHHSFIFHLYCFVNQTVNFVNMSPPFADGSRPRGPPPFVAQLLRMPMTLNNLIALAITQSVYRNRKALLASDPNTRPCAARVNGVFGILTILFAASVFHNIMSVMRFHRIRREVFGESMCAARRRWRQQGEIVLDEEERKARKEKFTQMSKKMPSLPIALGDIVLAVGFLGMWLMTTLIAKKEGKVELGVAYASIGALVAW